MGLKVAANRYGITTPRGFRASGCTCGIKDSGLPDLMIIAADRPVPAAGVFTTNKVKGAPVIVSKEHLRSPLIQAVVCSSGNSNVYTGQQGLTDAKQMCELTAMQIDCKTQQVLVCSTGVIGKLLPMNKITRGITALGLQLGRGAVANDAAARAILTTDLVTKQAYRRLRMGSNTINLAGMAKGSGMIAPNMATMLAFITTDAAITPQLLNSALRDAVKTSFNRISVDPDQSTSDSVILLASGDSGQKLINSRSARYDQFVSSLKDLCRDLAYQLIEDGEGASRIFRVIIQGASSEREADLVARAIVGSPLVKTAVHGADPNWGRILAAAGSSGAAINPKILSLTIGKQLVIHNGQLVSLNRDAVIKLNNTMNQKEITFMLDLNKGKYNVHWLGCDLSKQYITINADYTT
jgi:glutamate N-acetyltransferase/amino-acid N-acetyltransferase